MRINTRFGSRDAAEVWDAEFRWREGGRLRDVTVDDTWQRVGEAIAAGGGGIDAGERARAYAHGFARWRLLPAAGLLAGAGTGLPLPCIAGPHVVLNCAAFVAGGASEPADVDWIGFAESARLALWLLDDAALVFDAAPPAAWVGLIGIGAALAALGIAYDSPAARALAARFAASLSNAVAEGLVLLAAERGARFALTPGMLERWRTLGVATEWLAAAERLGLRQLVTTRVARVPILARLAGTTDALDPVDAAPAQGREARSALQRAMQPWIDDPIEAASS